MKLALLVNTKGGHLKFISRGGHQAMQIITEAGGGVNILIKFTPSLDIYGFDEGDFNLTETA